MTALLDVNVLVALLDPRHVFHDVAHHWFGSRTDDWATCPITENGTIRVISHPRYPNSTGTASSAAELVSRLRGLPGHVFWADAVSLVDRAVCDTSRLTTSGQVTDSYLLALAVANSGRLATFDQRLVTSAVRGGDEAVIVLGAR
ncbi:MAG TPA: PIN domain-containing protein [Actinomycetota bacterium]|nr:PIN domain-containing protein [Actinomycetota bacterium]